MRRTWAAACKQAGVSGVSLYEGTKHSTATHRKALGADDRVLGEATVEASNFEVQIASGGQPVDAYLVAQFPPPGHV